MILLLVQILVGCCVTLFLLNRSIVIDGNTAEVRLGLPRFGRFNQLRWLQGLVCLAVPFAEIHSIQLLDEEARRTSESMFWSYELNLVLRDENVSTLLTMAINGRPVGMLVICHG